MNILFDLNHPVDVNFFKNAILSLKKDGHIIYIIFRGRGNLERILKFELKSFSIKKIGEHKKGFLNKIVAQLNRDYSIIPYIKKNKINLVVCFGPTSVISAKFCGVPYLAFDDDFEYKIPFYHANWFSTRHIYPDFIEFSNSKSYKYHGFKELAYLHYDYLNIRKNVLNEYSLSEGEFVFIREIAGISLNYKDEVSILSEIVDKVKQRGLNIVLSLEDKSILDKYKNDCIVLEEPVSDIYSLMYHSLFAISSGDTVARETALLGLPTIYTGGRDMVVNKALIEAGLMYVTTEKNEIEDIINDLTLDKKKEGRENIINLTKNKWENTTYVILKHINDFIK